MCVKNGLNLNYNISLRAKPYIKNIIIDLLMILILFIEQDISVVYVVYVGIYFTSKTENGTQFIGI